MTKLFMWMLPLLLLAANGVGCDDGGGSSEAECDCYCPGKNCPAVKETDIVCPELPEVVEEPEKDIVEPKDTGGDPVDALKIVLSAEEEVLSALAQVEAKVTGGVAVMGVEFYVDVTRIDTDLIPPYTATINTTDFPDGPHFVTVFTAETGGQTASDSISIVFDNTPPQILTTVPTDGDSLFFEDGPMYLEMTVDDVDSIKAVEFRANGLLIGEFVSAPFFINVDWSTLFIDVNSLPKNVYLQFAATDYLGQQSEASFNITVNRRLGWQFNTVGEIWGSAVAFADGSVVFGNNDQKLYCLGPGGSQLWVHNAGNNIMARPAIDVAGDRVFYGDLNGTVRGINKNGGELWSKDIATPPGGDMVYANGLVYVSGYSGVVYALNPSNGSTQWQASLPAYTLSGPGVGADGRVYVGCQDNHIYAIQDGSIVWNIPTGNEVWSDPVVGPDNVVYCGSNDGWLYAINPQGTSKWVKEVSGQIWGRPMVSSDGFVYVASTLKYVSKRDAAFGLEIWSTKTDGISDSSPVEGPDGTIYIGSTGGKLYALDGEDGHIKWTFQVGDTIHATPVIANGRAHFGSTDRNFYSVWLNSDQ